MRARRAAWLGLAARSALTTRPARATRPGFAVMFGLAAAALALCGCGAAWTYDGAMQLHREYYDFQFEAPDSVAFALPVLPPVYAVVFQEAYYIPPPEPMVLSRPIRPGVPADSVRVEIAFADPAAGDSVFVGPVLDLGPPPLVRVDLTPAQEEEFRSRAQSDIAQASRLLDTIPATRREPTANHERVAAARGLLLQAAAALEREDYQGAANLAEKARLLAENLAASRP